MTEGIVTIKRCRYCKHLDYNPDCPRLDLQPYWCDAIKDTLTETDILDQDFECNKFKPTDAIKQWLDLLEENSFI